MGHFNTNANKAATDRSVVRHVVGSDAIAVNDLLAIGERGKVWPVQSKPFGAISKAGTELSRVNIQRDRYHGTQGGYLRLAEAYFDKATLSTFVANVDSADYSNNIGLYLVKYNESCEAVKHIVLLTDANKAQDRPFIKPLSNGNLLVVYQAGNDPAYFQIFNKNLDVIVPATSMGSIKPLSVVALSGGGFAVLANASGNTIVTFSSYTNAGAAVVTPVTLTTVATDLEAIELSNGNIGICLINGGGATASVATVNLLGSYTSALTPIPQLIASSNPRLSISAINGFFCCVVETDTRFCGAVFTNSGQLKNYNNTYTFGVTTYTAIRNVVLLNDGSGFWILAPVVNSTTDIGVNFTVAYLPTTGLNTDNKLHILNYHTTFQFATYSSSNNTSIADLIEGVSARGFYKRNTIVFAWKNSVVLLDVSNGSINSLRTIEHDPDGLVLPVLTAKRVFIDVGDGCYFWTNQTTAGIKKYLDTTIIGTSKINIPAGNEDTAIDLIVGPGSYTINPIPGKISEFVDNKGNVSETDYIYRPDGYASNGIPFNGATPIGEKSTTIPGSKYSSGTIFNNSVLFNKQ